MHSSKLPVQKWIVAIYYLLTARKGISSLQLSKELGITQKSSWFMLQRIREACTQGDLMLSNIMEADEITLAVKRKINKQVRKPRKVEGLQVKQWFLVCEKERDKLKQNLLQQLIKNHYKMKFVAV